LAYYGYPSGAVISGVTEGSPADDAGIERGDIITEFNGTEITEYSVLTELLNDLEPNDTVPLKIYRSGRYYSLNITIGANG
jgi:serine protease Do